MKTVFGSNQEVCHVWASQSQECGEAGHISFEGPVLCSYNAQIARIVDNIVLLTTRHWSVTTSAHQSLAWSAVSHMKKFHVYSVSLNDHKANIEHYFNNIKDSHDRYFRARTNKAYILDENNAIHAEMLEYTKHFDVDYPNNAFGMTSIGAFVLSENGLGIQKERFEAERKAKREKAKADKLEANEFIARSEKGWIAGKTNDTSLYFKGKHIGFSCTRLRLNGDDIETSQHARAPQKDCRVLYKAIKAGKPVHGLKVGMYTVNGCNGDLTIGCHIIPRHEVDRLAVSLGW